MADDRTPTQQNAHEKLRQAVARLSQKFEDNPKQTLTIYPPYRAEGEWLVRRLFMEGTALTEEELAARSVIRGLLMEAYKNAALANPENARIAMDALVERMESNPIENVSEYQKKSTTFALMGRIAIAYPEVMLEFLAQKKIPVEESLYKTAYHALQQRGVEPDLDLDHTSGWPAIEATAQPITMPASKPHPSSRIAELRATMAEKRQQRPKIIPRRGDQSLIEWAASTQAAALTSENDSSNRWEERQREREAQATQRDNLER